MIIFDDGRGDFGPLTDLRACFELRSGVATTAQRIIATLGVPLRGYWAPDHLAGLLAERGAVPVNRLAPGPGDGQGPVLCVNGRWALPGMEALPGPGAALLEKGSGDVVAANLDRRDVERFLGTMNLPPRTARREDGPGLLYRHPWDILAKLPETLAADIGVPASRGRRVTGAFGDHSVSVHASAQVCPGVVFDAQHGPIAVHEGAVLRPGAILCGPCSVGPKSVVVDRALIKANTVIGPVCKVGGEVGGTIFQGFANKSHDGHLGDSWVGEWVNIGAGSDNSNLLNTYGEVAMRLNADGPLHRTGRQFVGAFIGDHAKLAIQTRLMTGSVIGTGAMIATTGAVPQVVRRLAWLTGRGEQTFRLEKFLETARAVMARRGVEPGAAYVAALRRLADS